MDYQNILIIKMSSLGDVIHTLPFAGALRQRFPKARISWLVHPQFGAFIPGPPSLMRSFILIRLLSIKWISRENGAR